MEISWLRSLFSHTRSVAFISVIGLAFFANISLADSEVKVSSFITLGTNSGPIPNPKRSQPANLLQYGTQNILVDVGDGVTGQLAKSKVSLSDVSAIFVSHLHFDHTGGLFAFLSQRLQAGHSGNLTIYGPPGIKRTVDGLFAAMEPMRENNRWIMDAARSNPSNRVDVIELVDGVSIDLGDIRVSTGRNSHYILSEKPGDKPKSLAYRFDLPGRSIVYTGDTGPSDDVEILAKGADVLVTEVMDADVSMALMASRPGMMLSDRMKFSADMLLKHFERQHLSPLEVGLMAKRANVRMVVITHNALPDSHLDEARRAISENFGGPFVFAEDLQSF